MHSDQTGRFPATSSSGNQYIMVLVEVDGNYIDAEPMKNRSLGLMVKTYQTLWKQLTEKGSIKPTTHILDNEASTELKDEIQKNCDIQLVPPDNHRRNLAERAIQTFKCHFKAVLAGVDDSFPMRLWDKLLPQTVLTLNLLRQANAAPTVSAYQYVRGAFDYNKMPLAPMGCAVQIYESRERRGTWAEHTTDGWYLETSKEHYRCHKVHVKRTNSERITDTVFFKHRYITQPSVTSADILTKAIDDLSAALKQQRNTKGIKEMEALRKLDELLNQKGPETTHVPNPTAERSITVPTPRVERPTPSVERNPLPTPRVETTVTLPSPRVDTNIQVPPPRGTIISRKQTLDTDQQITLKRLPSERVKVRDLSETKY